MRCLLTFGEQPSGCGWKFQCTFRKRMKTLVTKYWFVVALLLAEWGPYSITIITTVIIIPSEWAVRCHVLSRGHAASPRGGGFVFHVRGGFGGCCFFFLPLQPSPRVLDSALCIPPSPSVSRGFWLRHAEGVNSECNVLEQQTSPGADRNQWLRACNMCVNKVLECDEQRWGCSEASE